MGVMGYDNTITQKKQDKKGHPWVNRVFFRSIYDWVNFPKQTYTHMCVDGHKEARGDSGGFGWVQGNAWARVKRTTRRTYP